MVIFLLMVLTILVNSDTGVNTQNLVLQRSFPFNPNLVVPMLFQLTPNHGGPDVVSLQPEPITSNVVSP